MSDIKYKNLTEGQQEALDLAESSRETEWHHPSFVAELFLGRFRADLIHPFGAQDPTDKKIGDEYIAKLEKFLREKSDPDKYDAQGKMDPEYIQGLKDLGAFGMKVPKEYGGLGLSQMNYCRALQVVGSHCASTVAWLSAHQSIGVPQPLKLFGTPEQKKKYMPLLTKNVSAFALTEPGAGSDPAGMTTHAEPTPDGKHYILNGMKLWCTNGAIADYLIVMARTPSKMVKGKERKQISAFIVEKTMPGFRVVHRCKFMGLNAIENALLEFKDVKVPVENMVSTPGSGLKLALVTLNAGRLSIPAGVAGGGRKVLECIKEWANKRVQWGVPIGKHEEIATKISSIAAGVFAIEAITFWSSLLVDRGGADIRLEAAMCKLFGTENSWKGIYDGIQILGGRGFEQSASLRARGEKGYPFERYMRDARINTILEGSTEVMHLFIAREALDAHMRLASKLFSPSVPIGKKILVALKAAVFYATWYPRQWIYFNFWPKYSYMGPKLSCHFRFIDRASHKLARSIFHLMARHQLGLERKQMQLARIVEIGTELFAMAATCSKAHQMLKENPSDETPRELADLFCHESRRRIGQHFRSLCCNSDKKGYKVAQDILKGKYTWMEDCVVKNNIK